MIIYVFLIFIHLPYKHNSSDTYHYGQRQTTIISG